jgi:hypothetical protein
MLNQMNRIGLGPWNRDYIREFLARVVYDPSTVVRIEEGGRVVREALLVGPRGSVLFQSVWGPDGRLFTFFLRGGG